MAIAYISCLTSTATRPKAAGSGLETRPLEIAQAGGRRSAIDLSCGDDGRSRAWSPGTGRQVESLSQREAGVAAELAPPKCALQNSPFPCTHPQEHNLVVYTEELTHLYLKQNQAAERRHMPEKLLPRITIVTPRFNFVVRSFVNGTQSAALLRIYGVLCQASRRLVRLPDTMGGTRSRFYVSAPR